MSKEQLPQKNEKLAELLRAQRMEDGQSMAAFARRFLPDGKEPERTYINWEQGIRAPQAGVRGSIEKAIGWKPGTIDLLLSDAGRSFGFLRDVQDLPVEERPVKRASELSDDELLTEVTRRFKTYADKAAALLADTKNVTGAVAADYDLAARRSVMKDRKKQHPPR